MEHHENNNNSSNYNDHHREDIQSSALVDERFLQTHSASAISARHSFDSVTNKCDQLTQTTPSHFAASIERFFQSEVRPLYFSDKNDAFLLLQVTVVATLLVNLFGILVYMQYDHLDGMVPRPVPSGGILRLLSAFQNAAASYYNDGQIVVGWMLSCWFLGYNVISAVIWWQFERRETRIPDDYEIIPSTRMRRRTATAHTHTHNNNMMTTTQEHQTQMYTLLNESTTELSMDPKKDKEKESENNPFDKSIVVISMPNGEFSVGKRQK